eukprot:7338150-Lingulodinium_polyedra.AAC.1
MRTALGLTRNRPPLARSRDLATSPLMTGSLTLAPASQPPALPLACPARRRRHRQPKGGARSCRA